MSRPTSILTVIGTRLDPPALYCSCVSSLILHWDAVVALCAHLLLFTAWMQCVSLHVLREAGSPQHSCWKSESWQYPCTRHLVCCAAVMRALHHHTSRNLTALLTQLREWCGMYPHVRACVCLACSHLIASSTGRQAQITKTPTNVTSMPVACLHTDSSCADARRVHVVPCLLLLCLFVVCVLPLLCSCRFPLAGVSCPAGRSPLLCVGVWSSGLRLGLALCAALLATPCCSVVQQDGSP
jgi:hypothetical protein